MNEKISVKKILNEGFSLYINNLLKIILPMALFAIPYYLFIAKIDIVSKKFGPDIISSYLSLGYVIITFVTGYINCVIIKISSSYYLTKDIEYSANFKVSPIMILGVFILSLIIGLATGIGFILLAFPGILLMLGWYVAIVVYINEDDENIFSSLSRSWELTSKNKGQLFLVILIIGLLSITLTITGFLIVNQGMISFSAFTDGSYVNFSGNPIYSILSSVLITPISTVLSVVVYFNLKINKEGFEIEQLSNNFMEGENESETHNW